MLLKENFGKVKFKEIIKYKIKRVLRILNYPFKKLES